MKAMNFSKHLMRALELYRNYGINLDGASNDAR